MAITIQGPDGASIDFPEGTSESEMNAAMAQAYPSQSAVPAPQGGGVMGAFKGASRALEANLPFMDRAVAAAKGGDYASNLSKEQLKNEQFAEQNPWTNAAGGIVASAPLAAVGGPSFGLGGLAGRVASAAVPWGAAGAVEGASSSPDLTNLPETAKDTAVGAATGGALGAAVPIAGAAVGKAISPLAAALSKSPGPADVAKLGEDVKGAYQNVKDIGASYSPQQLKGLTDKIAQDAAEADIDPSLNPKAASVIANLQKRAADAEKSGKPVTLGDLDRARQFVNDNLSGLPEPKQARFGSLIKNNIDDFIKTAEPQTSEAPYSALKDQEMWGESRSPEQHILDAKRNAGEMSNSGLVVAAKTGNGAVKYGQPGQLHADLYDPSWDIPEEGAGIKELGFARPGGPFMSRKEAFNAAAAPIQVSSEPSAADALKAIQTARDLAMRQFKAKALAGALDKAQIRTDVSGTGGNIENATRQRLAAILDKEPWSQDETAQLNKMIHGTPVTNSLRQVSRLSPIGNALTTMLEGGGSLATGSPWPAVAAGAGMAAQGAGALARRNAQGRLLATILAGGKVPPSPSYSAGPTRAALAAALAARQQLPPQGNRQRQ